MNTGKRFVFLSGLAVLNLLFAVKDVSMATPDSNLVNSVGNIMVADGAVLARSSFPEPQNFYYIKTKKTISVVITGYSSSVDETDDTPYITASGTFVRHGVAASNFLPLGTKFRVPEIYGDKVFTIEDRMNPRYNDKNWVDIWFDSKATAKVFGKKSAEIEVL
ncbi:3D domain-containing protein [Candidatus Wolfebacteria bacterium]|nr:3D domain-containing protein [Candidatus Wolfebacteria bacterium]